MSMMEKLNFFLGHKIKHTNDGIFISQNKCTSDILKRFEIELKPTTTPMSSSIKLDKDNQGILVDIAEYWGVIGFLIYLNASRPNITFSLCLCAKFLSNPKESYLLPWNVSFDILVVSKWHPRWFT